MSLRSMFDALKYSSESGTGFDSKTHAGWARNLVHRCALAAAVNIAMPFAVGWVKQQERRILRHGSKLDKQQIDDAFAVGVTHPERVRLLKVDEVPMPAKWPLRPIGVAAGLIMPGLMIGGMTMGYGVYVRASRNRNRALIAHELTHVGQYERLGGIRGFLREYIRQCLTVGYNNAPLEQEAYNNDFRFMDFDS